MPLRRVTWKKKHHIDLFKKQNNSKQQSVFMPTKLKLSTFYSSPNTINSAQQRKQYIWKQHQSSYYHWFNKKIFFPHLFRCSAGFLEFPQSQFTISGGSTPSDDSIISGDYYRCKTSANMVDVPTGEILYRFRVHICLTGTFGLTEEVEGAVFCHRQTVGGATVDRTNTARLRVEVFY